MDEISFFEFVIVKALKFKGIGRNVGMSSSVKVFVADDNCVVDDYWQGVHNQEYSICTFLFFRVLLIIFSRIEILYLFFSLLLLESYGRVK